MTEERSSEDVLTATDAATDPARPPTPQDGTHEVRSNEGPTPADGVRSASDKAAPRPVPRPEDRKPRAKVTLRIPDDEIARPTPTDPLHDPARSPAVSATRIISIGTPRPTPPPGTMKGQNQNQTTHRPPLPTLLDLEPSTPDVVLYPAPASSPDPDGTDEVAPMSEDIALTFDAAPPVVDAAVPIDVEESLMSSRPGSRRRTEPDGEEVRFDDDPPHAQVASVSDAPEVSSDDLVSVETVPSIGHSAKKAGDADVVAPAPSSPRMRVPIPPHAEQSSIPPPPSPSRPQVAETENASGPDVTGAPRRKTRPWWEDLFDEDFIRTMAKISDDQVAVEVNFIEESLGVAKGGSILDLACGTGRHAIELATRGYQVTGLDLSPAMLACAKKSADISPSIRFIKGELDLSSAMVACAHMGSVRFVQGDMREMLHEDTFDGIYAWNTSFGFFEEEKNAQIIQRLHRALKSRGMLLLDVANRDYLMQQQPSLAWFEGEGCVCMDEMQIDWITSRMRVKRTMMLEDERMREIEYSIRVYSLHELGKILHDHGFRVAEVSGRVATPGVFFGGDSPRALILAEKR